MVDGLPLAFSFAISRNWLIHFGDNYFWPLFCLCNLCSVRYEPLGLSQCRERIEQSFEMTKTEFAWKWWNVPKHISYKLPHNSFWTIAGPFSLPPPSLPHSSPATFYNVVMKWLRPEIHETFFLFRIGGAYIWNDVSGWFRALRVSPADTWLTAYRRRFVSEL